MSVSHAGSPLLALTMGDPAGVGPEIIAGAWPGLFVSGNKGVPPCRPVVFGHPEIIRRAAELRGVDAEVVPISSLGEAAGNGYRRRFGPKKIPCLQTVPNSLLDFTPASICRAGGEAAWLSLNRGIDAALSGEAAAIVTAPLNKKSLNMAGHHYPGHTEILAEKCGVENFAMMLYLGPGENLRSRTGLSVVHVTLHTAMRNVFAQITRKSVFEKICLIRDFARIMKGKEPKIGVCALNCHNGENGLFGDEEIRKIAPAVKRAASEGFLAYGPFPSDTLMKAAQEGEYDGIVAMIHDQGHIAVKLMGMFRAVNVTLGLPIIRTSVAHGTAFDRAWKGTATTAGMFEAVRVAVKLAHARNRG
ncbi:MAG: 4-hydroxythreonine-4-phosphate dehydrogenase PdxA [Thermoguttaceae bacterium]|nr:4-hydroxythreonine-4-phosphate dehydrogenase PdxA [Thermoguttaceae bacterium]